LLVWCFKSLLYLDDPLFLKIGEVSAIILLNMLSMLLTCISYPSIFMTYRFGL
jgi:hypothetical protein